MGPSSRLQSRCLAVTGSEFKGSSIIGLDLFLGGHDFIVVFHSPIYPYTTLRGEQTRPPLGIIIQGSSVESLHNPNVTRYNPREPVLI